MNDAQQRYQAARKDVQDKLVGPINELLAATADLVEFHRKRADSAYQTGVNASRTRVEGEG